MDRATIDKPVIINKCGSYVLANIGLDKFVTWMTTDRGYEYGNYFSDLKTAQNNLFRRAKY